MQKIENIYFKNKSLNSRDTMSLIKSKRKSKPGTAAAAISSHSK